MVGLPTCPDCGGTVGRQPGVQVEGGAPVLAGWCDDCGRELRLRPGGGWEPAHRVGGPWCW